MFSANTSQVSNDVKYIEDFFSAWLRTGTGSSQTVTTGIKENTGALVISKSRSAATDWAWYDTFRGATKDLVSNSTAAETTQSQGLTAFNTDGHTWGTLAKVNTSGATYVDFVLKPTPKFFDVVTYTGDGTSGREISHNLNSVPGCIIVKKLNAAKDWCVYHRSLGTPDYIYSYNLYLNLTDAKYGYEWFAASAFQTSTKFKLGSTTNIDYINGSGETYVAYLFAHNAGGFGLTGTDNVISCGAFTTDGSTNAFVELGYEPQWVMIKNIQNTGDWFMYDNMRGWSQTTNSGLRANLSNAEFTSSNNYRYTYATGFKWGGDFASNNYIYIAIRRGPMKTPTSGTKVFSPNTSTTNPQTLSTGFPVDLSLVAFRGGGGDTWAIDRLRGSTGTSAKFLVTQTTSAEGSSSGYGLSLDSNTGVTQSIWNNNSIFWNFRRAPGFFDEVCYTGTGVARTVAHNLGVAPELMIVKCRNAVAFWPVYAAPLGITKYLSLNQVNGAATDTGGAYWNNTSPTSSVFSLGTGGPASNSNGNTYVAYLFASCPGVSKVGSYTGTGATQQINCGFTAGARFVLIKRTDNTGDWYVWDTARGIVAGNDPYLLLNSTAAEVTTTDYVDTYSAGFEISSTAPAAINANGGSFIYLAIA